MSQLVNFDISDYVFPASIYNEGWGAATAIGLNREQRRGRRRWLRGLEIGSRSPWHEWAMGLVPSSAPSHLRTALLQHGFFAERFFVHAIRGDSLRSFYATPIPATEFNALAGLAYGGRGKAHFRNDRDRIDWWMNYFYDQLVVKAVQDPAMGEHLQSWFNENSETRRCVICGRAFRVIDRPYWLYFVWAPTWAWMWA